MIEIQALDEKMKDIMRLVDSVASTKSSILIQGETGSGKSTMAKFIHGKSNRANGPMIVVNCAQQPEALLDTELFGFEKGAFAGTVSEKRGKFELANGGTIVLDDVLELTPKLQQKVLRVLETGMVERIGGKLGFPADVRVVALTGANVSEAISGGKFLDALFYRLSNVQIMLPPLRERKGDFTALVSSMMGRISTRTGRKVSGITEEAVTKLADHAYPGNLRELEGTIERAMMMASDGVIRLDDVATGADANNTHQGTGAHSQDWENQARWAPGRTLDEIERAVILRSLAYHNGNRTHTARELGISIRTLRNKLNEYRRAGIDV